MLGIRHRYLMFLAALLLAGLIYGCKEAEEEDEGEETVSAQLGGRLEPGFAAAVRLWGEHSDHVYEGKRGEVITLSVTSQTPGLDPNVRLFGPGGGEEAFDDDSGGNGYALIQDYLLGSNGTYTVRIETDEDQPGDVLVLLSRKGDVKDTMGTAEFMTTAEPMGTDLQTDR